jgi:hypothetical protein
MATTLIEVLTKEFDACTSALAAAQSDMTAAQAKLSTAKVKLDADAVTLKELTSDITSNRGKLTSASIPSEVAALNAKIRDQLIEQRRLQGVILDDQEAVALAQAEVDANTKTMNRMKRGVASAKTVLDSSVKSGKDRDKLKKSASEPPFKTLKADAAAFASGPTAADAQAVINANIPVELQALLVERHATRVTRDVTIKSSLAEAESAQAAALGATLGVGGEVVEKEIDFARVDRQLREYVETAKRRFDHAVSLLSDLQKIKNDPKLPNILTAAEKADVKVTAERAAAAKKAEDVDDKLNSLINAEKTLDAGVLTRIEANVDTLSTDSTLKALRNAVVNAQKDFTTSRSALVTSGDKKLLDEWEIIVQDTVWQKFLEYADAQATLAELQSTDPANLVSDLDAAEDAYAAAIVKAGKAQRRVDAYSDVVQLRAKRAEVSAAALPARLFSAVRGDSY